MTSRSLMARLGIRVAVVAVALIVLAIVIGLAGFNVHLAVWAAVDGALGSSFAVLSATLKRATPLLFLGISVAVAFRAGVLNIGAEGQFLAGAAAAALVGLHPPAMPGPVIIFLEGTAATVAGGAWAAIAAWLKVKFRVAEVVSTLLLNFVAANLVGFLVRGPLQEPKHSYPQSRVIDEVARLPLIVPGQRLHWGFVLALCTALGAWWFFRYTASGFRAFVSGLNPTAAASAGMVSVTRVQAWALIVSGAIAGVAGFSELTGVTYALYEGLSPGYGYTAIAVALLGALHPIGIIAAAGLFGALGAGADAMQRDAGIPAAFGSVLAAVVVLGVLTIPAIHSRLQRRIFPVNTR